MHGAVTGHGKAYAVVIDIELGEARALLKHGGDVTTKFKRITGLHYIEQKKKRLLVARLLLEHRDGAVGAGVQPADANALDAASGRPEVHEHGRPGWRIS